MLEKGLTRIQQAARQRVSSVTILNRAFSSLESQLIDRCSANSLRGVAQSSHYRLRNFQWDPSWLLLTRVVHGSVREHHYRRYQWLSYGVETTELGPDICGVDRGKVASGWRTRAAFENDEFAALGWPRSR